jgi:hypothetical protein
LQAGLADTAASFVAVADAADAHAQSWMGWQYKPFERITGWGLAFWDEDGRCMSTDGGGLCDGAEAFCSLNETTVRLVARTYAQAVAGDITAMSFDNDTR